MEEFSRKTQQGKRLRGKFVVEPRTRGEGLSTSCAALRSKGCTPLAQGPLKGVCLFKISFIHERHKERGRDIGRGRSRFLVRSLMWVSVPGPQDHDLSQRQILNHRATQVSLTFFFSDFTYFFFFFLEREHK